VQVGKFWIRQKIQNPNASKKRSMQHQASGFLSKLAKTLPRVCNGLDFLESQARMQRLPPSYTIDNGRNRLHLR
jgi:hypothetical protein